MFIVALTAATIAANAANTYTKVTTTPTDWAGTYLIVCESQNVVFNGGADTTNIDSKGGSAILSAGFTISNDTLYGSLTVDTATFTIGTTSDPDWPWYIQSASGLYLGHKDTADNGLSTELVLEDKCMQKLEIDGEGNFAATPKYATNGPYNLRYNKDADQLRFRYYEPTKKKAVQLYRLVGDPTALPQLTNSPIHRFTKVIKDGRMLVIRDGQEYGVLGN